MIELTKEYNLYDEENSSFEVKARVVEKGDGVHLTLSQCYGDEEYLLYLDSKELNEFIKLLNTAKRTINE